MKIKKTKTGNYTAVVSVGKDIYGKQITKRFTAPTRLQVMQDAADYIARHRQLTESHSLEAALARYIALRENKKSPATIRGYNSIKSELLKNYPDIAAKRTDDLTPVDLQSICDSLQVNGRTTKTISNHISLLISAIRDDGAIPPRMILPERKRYAAACPSETEMKMILILLHGHDLEVPVSLAINGLRRGEICALTPDDLDNENVLHIHRSAVYDSDGFLVIKETPKTSESDRYVRIPAYIARKIREQGFITRYSPSGLSEAYTYFLNKYKFPHYRLHDCRHFFASYCHKHGVPEADILAGGGWRTANIMRNVYRHAIGSNQAASCMSAFTGS